MAAWWRDVAKRPAVLWTILALDLFIGLEAGGAAAYAAVNRPEPVNVGRIPTDAATVAPARPSAGPQPAPAAILIPSIGVKSDLVPLGVTAKGVLEVPKQYSKAGWWQGGPAPGADGAAVIVGHVDSKRGAAVFYKARTLQPGALIDVRRVDGTSAIFVVDAVRQFAKDRLPSRLIYGPTVQPELRLITCGGSFDKRGGSYRDNVVVFAHQQAAA